MKNIFVVYGTRPEAIKLAPLLKQSHALKNEGIELQAVFTGQHRDLVAPIHAHFEITPTHNLDIMTAGQSLNAICTKTMNGLEAIFAAQGVPAGVIVQGDTTSCFAAALCAFYRQIPVFHVEAGLRSYDMFSPYPEEFNRRGVSLVADIHFAPTEPSAQALRTEKIPENKIVITGNTAIDALRLATAQSRGFMDPALAQFYRDSNDAKTLLVTLHRRENFGEPLKNILSAIKSLLETRPELRVLLFAHPNPNVQTAIQSVLSQAHSHLLIAPPTDYFNFIECMSRSHLILSDSGGVQEEAPHLGIPVLVARTTTERPEAVAAGSSVLVGVDSATIIHHVTRLLDNPSAYEEMARARNPYGDGFATQVIFNALADFYRTRR
jgi:UDP-N-acetylglucosamine 2-epimerase (non-hydrolysing)